MLSPLPSWATLKMEMASTLCRTLALVLSPPSGYCFLFLIYTSGYSVSVISPLQNPFTLIWLLISWNLKLGSSNVLLCIIMTGLWKHISHSLSYVAGGWEEAHSNKESEISCQIPPERQENALCFVSHFIIRRLRVSDLWLHYLHSCIVM